MKLKTSELQGAALDWAVAKCEGFEPFSDSISWIIDDGGKYIQLPKYSTDWSQGGPIIEREKISVAPIDEGSEWCAEQWWAEANYSTGPTPLVAAMRCYVASKLGDEVEVPDQLLQGEIA